MRRRKFITLLGGAAVAWPFSVRAQQGERMRRIGVLMFTTSDEPESQARITAFGQGLQEAGWSVGRNVRIDVRWSGGDFERVRRVAQELVSLGPDVLVAGIGPTTQAFQQISRTLPIVFAQSVDPVGLGIVKSMARPGGNVTGFMQFEYSLGGKWLELLRSNPQGREARRNAGLTVDQMGVRHQHADSQGAWPRDAQLSTVARRRGD